MKKGFTLIELVGVIVLIAILSVILIPKLKDNVAKARDSNAVALLGAIRISSETYYSNNELTPFGDTPPTSVNNFNSIQDEDKEGVKLLINELSDDSKSMFDTIEYTVEIGGVRNKSDGEISYGQDIGYTFYAPLGSRADGVNLWFIERAIGTEDGSLDTKGKAWIEY